MSNPGGIRTARAHVEIGTNLDPLSRGLKQAQARLKMFAAQTSQMGQSAIRVGAALAAPLSLATVIGANFDRQMSRVKALTGATAEEIDLLRNKAKELGKATQFSASQAAEAMGYFGLAGKKTDDILQAMKPTLDLAAAGQLDMASASDIVLKIMSGMGEQISELPRVVDVLTKGFTSANTDLMMLGEAFKYVGPLAKSAGMDLEETTAMIMALSNSGIQAEMAGTTIRGMLLSLTSPSAEAAGVLASMGISVRDSNGDMRSMIDIITDLEKGTKNLGSADRLNILGRIFPARQAAGAAEFVAQGGATLQTLKELLQGSEGAADRIAAIQMDNLTGDFIIAKSAAEGLAIEIEEHLDPVLRWFTKIATDVIGQITSFIEANKGLVVGVAIAAAGIFSFGASMLALSLSAKVAGLAIGMLLKLVGIAKFVFLALASPIGLTIAAVLLLGAAIVHMTGNSEKVLTWLGENFTWLSDTASDAFGAITSALTRGDTAAAAEIFWLALQSVWLSGTHKLSSIWLDFKHAFVSTWFQGQAEIEKGMARLVATWKSAQAELAAIGQQAGESTSNWWEKQMAAVRHGDEQERIAKAFVDGKLTKEEAEQKLDNNNKTYDDAIRYADSSTANAQRAIDTEATAKQSAIAAELASAMAAADAENAALQDANVAEYVASQQALSDRLDAARAAFAAAVAEEKKNAEKGAPGKPGTNEWDEKQIKTAIAAAMAGMSASTETASSSGSFNAAGLFGMGSDSLADRTAKAAEMTALNTQIIARFAQQGPQFE